MANARWLGQKSRCIETRIVVEGDLVLQTPAHFGNGDSDALTDMPLLVDAVDGVSPLLTGATLAGALRAYLHSREQGYRQQDKPGEDTLTELLFGGFKGDDDGAQSNLIVDDTLGQSYSVSFRDGVRLDPQTRTAYVERIEKDDGQVVERGHLFDMKAWSAGTTFPIRLELLLTKPERKKGESDPELTQRKEAHFMRLKEALLTALQGLTDGGITLGGRKNRGYGRITVNNWRVKAYHLLNKSELIDWLETGNSHLQTQSYTELIQSSVFEQFKEADLIDKRSYFRMEATFKLDGSLLIRANGIPGSNSPDMVHLSDHTGKPVLSGTSVTGALRQRARRILNLVNPDQAAEWLNDLFGDEEMKDDFYASRLITEETLIEKPQFDLIQNRVAIDRFTGGALDTALFNEQPVFGRPETHLQINITIRKPGKQDIGLLLLLLKDLWTGDLPIGGEASVGRGRLAGKCVQLTYRQASQTEIWELIGGDNGEIAIKTESKRSLQSFVDALHGKEVADGA